MKPVANRLSSMCAVSEDTCTGPAEDEQVSPETRLFAASCIAMARASQNESLVVGYDDGSALATYTVELDRHAGLQRFRSALERVVARGVPDAMVRCVDITGRDPSGIHDLVFRLQDRPEAETEIDVTTLRMDTLVPLADADCSVLRIRSGRSRHDAGFDARLRKAFVQALSLLDAPLDATLADIILIDPETHRVVVDDFNKTVAETPVAATLVDLLMEQVSVRPESIAATDGETDLTFSQLHCASMGVASALCAYRVDRDDCIGLFVESSLDLIVCAWGILHAGAAYLPLSPDYPDERLRYMLEDFRAGVVVTQEALKKRLAQIAPVGTRILTVEEAAHLARAASGSSAFAPGGGVEPRHLAYVIYTSGSTGRPKGVMIEHGSIVNQMQWLQDRFHLSHGVRILQKTPMSFDAAQWEILAPSCGATAVIGAPGIHRNPQLLVQTIRRTGVTALQCVPTLLQALLEEEDFTRCESLRQIFCGGEALSRHLVNACGRLMPGREVVNLYGPTECTINSSAFVADFETTKDSPDVVSIGSPIRNTVYYILDNCMSPVGIGEIGELHIGGAGLARGYLHRPEMTEDKFIPNPFSGSDGYPRLYRTGDLARWNPDGTVQFVGRADSQVKLRGYRIELDEIRLAIENHAWVRHSAVVVKGDPQTCHQNLIAFIELDERQAALMDQGNHDAHHHSKESKAQVLLQLANKGCRESHELEGRPHVQLSGIVPTDAQHKRVFARKTYRFFEGGITTRKDIIALLSHRRPRATARGPEWLSADELGHLLRYFGAFRSDERLLPKYGYASPGSLYATQMYLEVSGIAGFDDGIHYYHPILHQLVGVGRPVSGSRPRLRVHFIGKRSAIEPIYKNNILEVLEIEAGHIVGLFDDVLLDFGLGIRPCSRIEENRKLLDISNEDYYLGAFEIVPSDEGIDDWGFEVYVQPLPGKIPDLPMGQYRFHDGALERIADGIIQRKDVIAINQGVYDRASFGITIVSRHEPSWLQYIALGRVLQRYQMSPLGFGFMSSGYSSKSGNDLPSAKRIVSLLGDAASPSYFFLGGKVSEEQRLSEGMKEDAVHMKGPAEMVKEDLAEFLPDYMVPNKVLILDRMPLSVNGKIDTKALCDMEIALPRREFTAPKNDIESGVHALWMRELMQEEISINDNFFELGGNSLIAVCLVNKLNKTFSGALPLQAIFQAPTIAMLAELIATSSDPTTASRLIPLQKSGWKRPMYCWPGLGGYCMNLRRLALVLGEDRPFYGVQAYGINEGEVPFATIRDMAAEDIKHLRRIQPNGPYLLSGYSFGTRVAFETAYQLERAGEKVEHLVLIAPGSPLLYGDRFRNGGRRADFDNPAFLAVLYSVFTGRIDGDGLEACLATVSDAHGFVDHIAGMMPEIERETIERIVKVVSITFEFDYDLAEMRKRRIDAPITIIKATGDDYSFLEKSDGYSSAPPTMISAKHDHYSLLRNDGVEALAVLIRRQFDMTSTAGNHHHSSGQSHAAHQHQALSTSTQ